MSTARARNHRLLRGRALASITPASLPATLLLPPKALGKTPVYQVVLSCPGIGPVACKDLFTRARVWPLTNLEELTSWERAHLVELLPERIKSEAQTQKR